MPCLLCPGCWGLTDTLTCAGAQFSVQVFQTSTRFLKGFMTPQKGRDGPSGGHHPQVGTSLVQRAVHGTFWRGDSCGKPHPTQARCRGFSEAGERWLQPQDEKCRKAAFVISVKLSGRVQFGMSSREPLLRKALGACAIFSLFQPPFSSSEDQPALTRHGCYQKGFLCKRTSRHCRGRGMPGGSSLVPTPPQTTTHSKS